MAGENSSGEESSSGTSEKGSEKKTEDLLAVVLIKSSIGAKSGVKKTLELLKLQKKNSCVLLGDNDSVRGMLEKIKDFVTYGEVEPSVVEELREARGDKDTDTFFRLHPPRGGFERKGIKTLYSEGGAAGYRGEDINNLLKKMI